MTNNMEKETIHAVNAESAFGLWEAPIAYGRHMAVSESQAEPSIAYFNMGNACRGENRPEEAIACYQRAVSLQPIYAEAYNNMGLIFQEKGDLDESIHCFQRAIESNPKLFHAYFNMGVSFENMQDVDDAIFCFQKALLLKPDLSAAYNRLGTIFREQGQLDKAIFCFKREIEIDPGNAQAYNNLGSAFHDTGAVSEAIRCFRKSLRLRPDHVETNWNLALAQLLKGDLAEGWEKYEWRLRKPDWASGYVHIDHIPRWDGRAFPGKSLLIRCEQGLGDVIQFVRYFPMVKAKGGTVMFETETSLARLLKGCRGIDELVSPLSGTGAGHKFDYHLPLLSLPRVFNTTRHTIPAKIPYLSAEKKLMALWEERLCGFNGLRIGICWQGNPSYKGDRFRSVPLKHFFCLAAMDGVHLISLQKRHGLEQLRNLPQDVSIIDFGPLLDGSTDAFVDTGAIMKNLDLVVTTDTAVAHLAGALGVPVWLLLQHVPEWRWGLTGEDTPWYPTMRLFRQSRPGDWDGVLQRVCSEVRSLLSKGAGIR
jgi:tetratricopeptide (TPR) repeat protein